MHLLERLLFGSNHQPARHTAMLLLSCGLALALIVLAGAVGVVLVCLAAILMAALRLVDTMFTRAPQL